MSYVICPETITSPAPEPGFMAVTGLGPNEPCGLRCEVVRLADAMEFCCGRGHTFIAARGQVHEDDCEATPENFELLRANYRLVCQQLREAQGERDELAERLADLIGKTRGLVKAARTVAGSVEDES